MKEVAHLIGNKLKDVLYPLPSSYPDLNSKGLRRYVLFESVEGLNGLYDRLAFDYASDYDSELLFTAGAYRTLQIYFETNALGWSPKRINTLSDALFYGIVLFPAKR